MRIIRKHEHTIKIYLLLQNILSRRKCGDIFTNERTPVRFDFGFEVKDKKHSTNVSCDFFIALRSVMEYYVVGIYTGVGSGRALARITVE
ncbi:hypothetical protein TSAR_015749 [Trichomalopsis sarcophagae]|uniref:Uncharacterized protein n=1 Tax=Trichomalopsis sarcophagae TaxID=543379 RepID=A0A232F689_9HYME|nr:hypothetical protein TSAR_015749 [Trichomalopsis sarcophagae]